jgi:hypothetical protein
MNEFKHIFQNSHVQIRDYNSILLYEFYKTQECSNRTSVRVRVRLIIYNFSTLVVLI